MTGGAKYDIVQGLGTNQAHPRAVPTGKAPRQANLFSRH
jgi:hypothetical protein